MKKLKIDVSDPSGRGAVQGVHVVRRWLWGRERRRLRWRVEVFGISLGLLF